MEFLLVAEGNIQQVQPLKNKSPLNEPPEEFKQPHSVWPQLQLPSTHCRVHETWGGEEGEKEEEFTVQCSVFQQWNKRDNKEKNIPMKSNCSLDAHLNSLEMFKLLRIFSFSFDKWTKTTCTISVKFNIILM